MRKVQRGSIVERRGATGLDVEVRVPAGARRLTRTIRARGAGPKAEREAWKEAERARTAPLTEVDQGGHSGESGSVADLIARWHAKGATSSSRGVAEVKSAGSDP